MPKSAIIRVRVEPETRDLLTRLAATHGRTLSDYVRLILTEHAADKETTT